MRSKSQQIITTGLEVLIESSQHFTKIGLEMLQSGNMEASLQLFEKQNRLMYQERSEFVRFGVRGEIEWYKQLGQCKINISVALKMNIKLKESFSVLMDFYNLTQSIRVGKETLERYFLHDQDSFYDVLLFQLCETLEILGNIGTDYEKYALKCIVCIEGWFKQQLNENVCNYTFLFSKNNSQFSNIPITADASSQHKVFLKKALLLQIICERLGNLYQSRNQFINASNKLEKALALANYLERIPDSLRLKQSIEQIKCELAKKNLDSHSHAFLDHQQDNEQKSSQLTIPSNSEQRDHSPQIIGQNISRQRFASVQVLQPSQLSKQQSLEEINSPKRDQSNKNNLLQQNAQKQSEIEEPKTFAYSQESKNPDQTIDRTQNGSNLIKQKLLTEKGLEHIVGKAMESNRIPDMYSTFKRIAGLKNEKNSIQNHLQSKYLKKTDGLKSSSLINNLFCNPNYLKQIKNNATNGSVFPNSGTPQSSFIKETNGYLVPNKIGQQHKRIVIGIQHQLNPPPKTINYYQNPSFRTEHTPPKLSALKKHALKNYLLVDKSVDPLIQEINKRRVSTGTSSQASKEVTKVIPNLDKCHYISRAPQSQKYQQQQCSNLIFFQNSALSQKSKFEKVSRSPSPRKNTIQKHILELKNQIAKEVCKHQSQDKSECDQTLKLITKPENATSSIHVYLNQKLNSRPKTAFIPKSISLETRNSKQFSQVSDQRTLIQPSEKIILETLRQSPSSSVFEKSNKVLLSKKEIIEKSTESQFKQEGNNTNTQGDRFRWTSTNQLLAKSSSNCISSEDTKMKMKQQQPISIQAIESQKYLSSKQFEALRIPSELSKNDQRSSYRSISLRPSTPQFHEHVKQSPRFYKQSSIEYEKSPFSPVTNNKSTFSSAVQQAVRSAQKLRRKSSQQNHLSVKNLRKQKTLSIACSFITHLQIKDKGDSPKNKKIHKNPSGESSNSSSISKHNTIEERSNISQTSVSVSKKPMNTISISQSEQKMQSVQSRNSGKKKYHQKIQTERNMFEIKYYYLEEHLNDNLLFHRSFQGYHFSLWQVSQLDVRVRKNKDFSNSRQHFDLNFCLKMTNSRGFSSFINLFIPDAPIKASELKRISTQNELFYLLVIQYLEQHNFQFFKQIDSCFDEKSNSNIQVMFNRSFLTKNQYQQDQIPQFAIMSSKLISILMNLSLPTIKLNGQSITIATNNEQVQKNQIFLKNMGLLRNYKNNISSQRRKFYSHLPECVQKVKETRISENTSSTKNVVKNIEERKMSLFFQSDKFQGDKDIQNLIKESYNIQFKTTPISSIKTPSISTPTNYQNINSYGQQSRKSISISNSEDSSRNTSQKQEIINEISQPPVSSGEALSQQENEKCSEQSPKQLSISKIQICPPIFKINSSNKQQNQMKALTPIQQCKIQYQNLSKFRMSVPLFSPRNLFVDSSQKEQQPTFKRLSSEKNEIEESTQAIYFESKIIAKSDNSQSSSLQPPQDLSNLMSQISFKYHHRTSFAFHNDLQNLPLDPKNFPPSHTVASIYSEISKTQSDECSSNRNSSVGNSFKNIEKSTREVESMKLFDTQDNRQKTTKLNQCLDKWSIGEVDYFDNYNKSNTKITYRKVSSTLNPFINNTILYKGILKHQQARLFCVVIFNFNEEVMTQQFHKQVANSNSRFILKFQLLSQKNNNTWSSELRIEFKPFIRWFLNGDAIPFSYFKFRDNLGFSRNQLILIRNSIQRLIYFQLSEAKVLFFQTQQFSKTVAKKELKIQLNKEQCYTNLANQMAFASFDSSLNELLAILRIPVNLAHRNCTFQRIQTTLENNRTTRLENKLNAINLNQDINFKKKEQKQMITSNTKREQSIKVIDNTDLLAERDHLTRITDNYFSFSFSKQNNYLKLLRGYNTLSADLGGKSYLETNAFRFKIVVQNQQINAALKVEKKEKMTLSIETLSPFVRNSKRTWNFHNPEIIDKVKNALLFKSELDRKQFVYMQNVTLNKLLRKRRQMNGFSYQIEPFAQKNNSQDTQTAYQYSGYFVQKSEEFLLSDPKKELNRYLSIIFLSNQLNYNYENFKDTYFEKMTVQTLSHIKQRKYILHITSYRKRKGVNSHETGYIIFAMYPFSKQKTTLHKLVFHLYDLKILFNSKITFETMLQEQTLVQLGQTVVSQIEFINANHYSLPTVSISSKQSKTQFVNCFSFKKSNQEATRNLTTFQVFKPCFKIIFKATTFLMGQYCIFTAKTCCFSDYYTLQCYFPLTSRTFSVKLFQQSIQEFSQSLTIYSQIMSLVKTKKFNSFIDFSQFMSQIEKEQPVVQQNGLNIDPNVFSMQNTNQNNNNKYLSMYAWSQLFAAIQLDNSKTGALLLTFQTFQGEMKEQLFQRVVKAYQNEYFLLEITFQQKQSSLNVFTQVLNKNNTSKKLQYEFNVSIIFINRYSQHSFNVSLQDLQSAYQRQDKGQSEAQQKDKIDNQNNQHKKDELQSKNKITYAKILQFSSFLAERIQTKSAALFMKENARTQKNILQISNDHSKIEKLNRSSEQFAKHRINNSIQLAVEGVLFGKQEKKYQIPLVYTLNNSIQNNYFKTFKNKIEKQHRKQKKCLIRTNSNLKIDCLFGNSEQQTCIILYRKLISMRPLILLSILYDETRKRIVFLAQNNHTGKKSLRFYSLIQIFLEIPHAEYMIEHSLFLDFGKRLHLLFAPKIHLSILEEIS